MIDIEIVAHEISAVGRDRLKTALDQSDFNTVRNSILGCVSIRIGSIQRVKRDAYIVDIAGELMSWLLSLGGADSKGYISFGNESFFYFDHTLENVSLYLYNPVDISDEKYQNYLGETSRYALIFAIINALMTIRASIPNIIDYSMQSEKPSSLLALETLIGLPIFMA